MRKRLAVWVLATMAGVFGVSVAADVFLFRGDFIYIIPSVVSDEMTRFASRGEWKHFSEHTRYLDLDEDGERDLVVAAFGAPTGYGAQLRYRLLQDQDGTPRLGRWYWAVVTAPDGSRAFEEFNP